MVKTMLYRALPLLICLLASCDKPAAPGAAGMPKDDGPGVSMTAVEIPFSSSVKGREFRVRGRGCRSLRVRLLHLVSGEVHSLTEHAFENLHPTVEGSFWLLAQDGEPFGQKGKICYSLTHSLKAGSVLTTSASPILFQGPFTMTSEATDTNSNYQREREHVIYRHLMSKISGSQEFRSGTVEELAKQTVGQNLEILAVTLRWE